MIQVKNFSKSYSNQIIIKESNFEIKSQRISFLMGPNGAGKTTTIKCLMGMENHLGEILFDGKKIDQVRDRCLVIWDDCPFYTNLSGFQNLLIFGEGKKSKNEIKEIASKYLDYHTIKNKVKTYSYGQKKKLALVLVEILEPKYLIMDEISNGLDFDMIRNLQKSIKSWSNSMTIILTGHQFSFYNEIIDDVFVIRDKEIVLLQENFSNSGIMLEDIYDEENS
ncbi:MAG: ABC transporter ATP-binding protein [Caldibacillus debilis]|jgi:ABC-type multidrug transport system ATPase subunit|uniref:ABC-type multidrug transport system, ATPase component n=2 Tax=Caldibacillus debilis TaxID=301148 RepID=A0A420VEV3_9BACI|nr:ATP-binding cassette domain-containing protein [Caldibacillus debilis]OUM90255.1 MAG: hypothetical protein BAA03_13555 [Caldibacillus debilis]REJ25518.1 MAG: ABC transporter ATP-binding protein [Caldibacillus debilis]RKO61903.1 ABC-type multidrug transport system, ATPase component [Caldibacillus debilis GB1]